jgi:uncharacterized SAM-binding protein YcdF (DUF218 family)
MGSNNLLKKRIRKSIFTGLVGAIFLTLVLGFTKLPWVLSRPIIIEQNVKTAPVIVVLYSGHGDIFQNGLDKYALARVQKAVKLYRSGWAPHILFSGGAADVRGNGLPGADKMAQEATRQGIPAEKIMIERCSRDTRQNAKNSAQIIREKGWNSIILVTNDFHMRRAMHLFAKRGLEVHPAPVEWQTKGKWESNWCYLDLLLKEVQARLAYLILNERQIDGLIDFLRPCK